MSVIGNGRISAMLPAPEISRKAISTGPSMAENLLGNGMGIYQIDLIGAA